jgi:hypothetical protein
MSTIGQKLCRALKGYIVAGIFSMDEVRTGKEGEKVPKIRLFRQKKASFIFQVFISFLPLPSEKKEFYG